MTGSVTSDTLWYNNVSFGGKSALITGEPIAVGDLGQLSSWSGDTELLRSEASGTVLALVASSAEYVVALIFYDNKYTRIFPNFNASYISEPVSWAGMLLLDNPTIQR